jgi:hypothetical protein
MESMLPKVIGKYTYKRATSRYYVFSRVNEDGRDEPQYINKKLFENGHPQEIEVLVRW